MKTLSSSESVLRIETSWGRILVKARDGLVTHCELPRLAADPLSPLTWGRSELQAAEAGDEQILKQADRFIRGLFGGQEVPAPAIAWPEAPSFTKRVWRELARIPRGRTRAYGEVAERLGCAGGARAVGQACGANPLPLFIPCHRVLPRDGSLGGFSCGLPWKRRLLEQERSALS